MHLILTGATGLVGTAVLQNMLNNPAVSKISILSRKPVFMLELRDEYKAKTKLFIHEDFLTYDSSLLEELKDAQGCVWAQGISATKVSKPEYIKITRDYPLAFANAFTAAHPTQPFTFVYVSGEGTTTTPGFFTPFFGKIKGQAEAALLALHKEHPTFKPYSARPGGVDPSGHKEILNVIKDTPFFTKKVNSVVKGWYSNMHSPTRELGKVLTELALSKGEVLEGTGVDGEGRTVSNVGLRRMAGL